MNHNPQMGMRDAITLQSELPNVEDLRISYPGVLWHKYLDQEDQLRRKVRNCKFLGLDGSESKQILDVGCGSGIFLFCAAHFGHKGIGLDVEHPLLAALARRYGVDRRNAPVLPKVPLEGDGQFDLVTMMNVAFDRQEYGFPFWTKSDWAFLLSDVEAKLTVKGTAYFRFGVDQGPIRQALGVALGRNAIKSRMGSGRKSQFLLDRNGLARALTDIRRDSPSRAALDVWSYWIGVTTIPIAG